MTGCGPTPDAFLKSSIVVQWRYVTPVQVARQIRVMRYVCHRRQYLDCVLEHADIMKQTHEFAKLHQYPAIAEPDVFLAFTQDAERRLKDLDSDLENHAS